MSCASSIAPSVWRRNKASRAGVNFSLSPPRPPREGGEESGTHRGRHPYISPQVLAERVATTTLVVKQSVNMSAKSERNDLKFHLQHLEATPLSRIPVISPFLLLTRFSITTLIQLTNTVVVIERKKTPASDPVDRRKSDSGRQRKTQIL